MEVAAIDSDGNITTSGTVDGIDVAVTTGHSLSTGAIEGGILSIGTPNTTGTISDGSGIIVNHTTPTAPTITNVSWSGLSNITLTNIGTSILTFVAINSGGSVVQQNTPFTVSQRRSLIVLGAFVHVDKATVNTVNQETILAYDGLLQTIDLAKSIGFFNVTGNVYSASVAGNLKFDKSNGTIHFPGSNYDSDKTNPNIKTLASLANVTFQYRFQDGTNRTASATGETDIDPNLRDNGTSPGTTVSTNKWTVQRIYSFISNAVKLQPGQNEYNSKQLAIESIDQSNFVTEPSIEANGLLRGWIVVQQGATNLTDPNQAQFIEAQKFGSSGGSSGIATDLQEAYNNSTSPEIVVDSTRGGFSVKDNATPIGSNLLEVLNNASTSVFGVNVSGNVTVSGTVD